MASEPLTVLQVSAEGGSIRLLGQRSFPLLDSAGGEPDPFEPWDAVLRALDYYPWTELHPTVVHPAFREYVLQAVSERTKDPRLLRKWQDVNDANATAPEGADGVTLSEWGFQVVTNEAALYDLLHEDD